MFNKQYKNLKKVLVLVSAATLGFFSAGGAYAASSAIEVPVTIGVNTALVIIAGDSLSFGVAIVDGSAGSVDMQPDSDTVTNSGGVLSVDQATAHRGFVKFISPDDGIYGVTLDSSINLTDPTTGNSLLMLPSVNVSLLEPSVEGEIIDVYLGGTITFGAGTQAGTYNGSVTLTFSST